MNNNGISLIDLLLLMLFFGSGMLLRDIQLESEISQLHQQLQQANLTITTMEKTLLLAK